MLHWKAFLFLNNMKGFYTNQRKKSNKPRFDVGGFL